MTKAIHSTGRLAAVLGALLIGSGVAAPEPRPATDPSSRAQPSTSSLPRSVAKAGPEMKQVLVTLITLGAKPVEMLTPEQAREQASPADAVKAVRQKRGKSTAIEPVAKSEDRTVGETAIPIRIYTPKGEGPFPVIVYYHGGGWVIGSLDVYDASARALANGTGAIVVGSSYRKAPEHKFPAAHDDAFTAYRWTLDNAASFDGDPSRIAVAGESAGGNLAFNTAIRARDEKITPPRHMLLVHPVAGSDTRTASYQANADAIPLGKAGMAWFFKHVFTNPEQAKDPRIDLVSRTDLAGLPPATVITAEIDPLRSEGQVLAKNLMAAGVTVDAVDYTGVTHEFFSMGAVVPKAKQAQQRASKNLKQALRPGAKVSKR